jgi:hypothetical protein
MPLDLSAVVEFVGDISDKVVHVQVPRGTNRRGSSGAPNSDFVDDPDRANLLCTILPRQTSEAEQQSQRRGSVAVKLIFPSVVLVRDSERIRYEDPARGTRYFLAEPSRDVAEQGKITIVNAWEFP